MRTDELDFDLPPDRIATRPAEPRDAARLLVCRRDRPTGRDLEHAHVRDLPRLGVLRAGDLMIVNRTRVLPAYFEATRAGTGGRVKGLYLEAAGDRQWLVMLEAKGSLQPGERLAFPSEPSALVLAEPRGRGAWIVRVEGGRTTEDLLARIGRTPLPPYIRRMRKHLGLPEIGEQDADRYNTVYAADPGSVAAPTAGLHFTPDLLAAIETLGVRRVEVTLSVGLGTFEPVRTEILTEHRIHRERVRVPAETLAAVAETRRRGGRVMIIGTTTVRAMESVPDDAATPATPAAHAAPGGGWEGETGLFIHPGAGFAWRFTDALMTNFHLPRSTLLAMVAALPGVGLPRLLGWYRQAIEHGYRFYSYGDAMLIV